MEATKKLLTENTGKMFEKAICTAMDISYDGKYKYTETIPDPLLSRLSKLKELVPPCIHTAKRGARYDFTCVEDPTKHLSAKSTKKGVGKVAPQVIGQAQPKKFCDLLGIPFTTNEALKEYIQTNPSKVLPFLTDYTFDCPTLFYNEAEATIRYITLHTPIQWDTYQYKWTCHWTTWSNSTTLKIVVNGLEMALVEFQFHTKSRSNLAIRWCYETFLTIFKENLTIVSL